MSVGQILGWVDVAFKNCFEDTDLIEEKRIIAQKVYPNVFTCQVSEEEKEVHELSIKLKQHQARRESEQQDSQQDVDESLQSIHTKIDTRTTFEPSDASKSLSATKSNDKPKQDDENTHELFKNCDSCGHSMSKDIGICFKCHMGADQGKKQKSKNHGTLGCQTCGKSLLRPKLDKYCT